MKKLTCVFVICVFCLVAPMTAAVAGGHGNYRDHHYSNFSVDTYKTRYQDAWGDFNGNCGNTTVKLNTGTYTTIWVNGKGPGSVIVMETVEGAQEIKTPNVKGHQYDFSQTVIDIKIPRIR